jgi:site-specific DNA recombinase
MTVSNIVRQSAYSGIHRVKTNGGKDIIEQPVPAVVEPGLQERAIASLKENKSYPNRKNDRKYLLRGLVRCATCGGACTGHRSSRRGKDYHYYACRAAKTYDFGAAPPHKPSFVRAEWLEELVWSDVRRFLENPGEVLERLREQHDAADDAPESSKLAGRSLQRVSPPSRPKGIAISRPTLRDTSRRRSWTST